MEFWKCNRCGNCCTHQKEHMDLVEEDLKFFPDKSYMKHMGIGSKKSSIKTIVWRLIPRRCPLYDEQVGCTIYENRPLICRRYPYTWYGIDNSCTNSPRGNDEVKVMGEDLKILERFDEDANKRIMKAVVETGSTKAWIYKNFKWRKFNPQKHGFKQTGKKII